MTVSEVRTLFAYSHWAHRRILEAVSRLSPEELDRDLRGSFNSIRGTLRHLLWGERGWLRFWKDRSFGPDLSPTELLDLPSLVAAFSALEKEQDAFARELTDEKLLESYPVDGNAYVLGDLIQHAMNHATHHRGQVVLMLRQLGKVPPGTGFRQFLTESQIQA